VRTGDVVRLDAVIGDLTVLVPADEWAPHTRQAYYGACSDQQVGMGRQLFSGMRQRATFEQGALSWFSPQVPIQSTRLTRFTS
jgi:phosphogluconate dehydratase